MRGLILISIISLLFSCKQSETNTTSAISQKEVLPIKESIFLTMERTPCLGRCASYKITIFNTGNVVYEGFSFVEKEGKYTKKLTQKQLSEIEAQIETIKLFELQDKYDSKITDIPSVYLFVVYNNKKKKIMDRVNGPKELKRFEKLIDFLVIDDNLKKVEE